MKKKLSVEEYIETYTRNCSNEITLYMSDLEKHYYPWLTPDNARAVVQIARKEVIEKAVNWLENNTLWGNAKIQDFKKALEEE